MTEKPPIEAAPKKPNESEKSKVDIGEEELGVDRKIEHIPVEPSLLFQSTENKTLFRKLGEKAKDLAVKVYEKSGAGSLVEKARINSVDRAKVMYDSRLYNWHDEKAQKWESRLSLSNKQIGAVENQIKQGQENLRSLKETFGNRMGPDIEAKALREEQNMKLALEKFQNKRDRAQSKLEFRNNKKAVYENAKKEVVRDVSGRIQERLKPHEGRIEELQVRKSQFDSEIGNLTDLKSKLEEQLEELEEGKRGATFEFEREQFQLIINETKGERREINNFIKSRVKERAKIESELIPVSKKANSWRDKLNQFHRISQRDTVYVAPGEREEVPADFEHAEISTAKRVIKKAPERGGYPSEEAATTREETSKIKPARVYERAEDKKFSPEDYIKQWNKYFGSDLQIKPDLFGEAMAKATGGKKEDKLKVKELEFFFISYIKEILERGARLPRRLSIEDINSRLKKLRFLS